MASVSVVHYNTSPHKVLQQSNNDRREIIILRKNPHILPQPNNYNKEDILITNAGRKKKPTTKDNLRTAPQPVAVARRNARERNRVKQVNNGFANLRQHIPNFIASAFESNTRGGSKKLSKVETLRMAVEYIRSLEDILAMDDNSEAGNISNNSSVSSFSSPSIQPYQIMSPSADEDDNTSTPPPQYIRIDTTTNTYQIIPAHLYDDSENLEPLDAEILSDLEFGGGSQDLLAGDSLSPGMYSEQSLSPGGVIDKGDGYGAIFDASGKLVQVKREDVSRDIPVISLKTEHELPHQHKTNVMDVMQWWEQQQSPHSS